MKNILITVLITLAIISCKTEPCIESHPILNFVSFPEPQTDSIILRRFTKNSNFQSLLDSVKISKNNSVYQQSNDTLHILTSTQGDYVLDIQFDYEVYLPLANRLFQISNFVQQQTEMKVGISMDKRQCINPITSYTLNGQVISGESNYPVVYLSK